MIGVNTAIVSTSGASAGLGFAVPVNDVNQSVGLVLEESTGDPTPTIGVAILDSETALENGIPEEFLTGGLVVLSVYPGSPAESAGMQGCRHRGNSIILGDQITAINGERISTFEGLKIFLSQHKPGDIIELEVYRDSAKIQIKLPLAARARRVLL